MRFEEALRIAKVVKLVVVSLAGDLASSNVRLKYEFGRQAERRNEGAEAAGHGFVALADLACAGHVVHRMVETCFQTDNLIGKLHATAFTFNEPGRFAQLVDGLALVVHNDL